jgi:hypothetical protein
MNYETRNRNWEVDWGKWIDWFLKGWFLMLVTGYLWHEEGFGKPLGYLACVFIVGFLDFLSGPIVTLKQSKSYETKRTW